MELGRSADTQHMGYQKGDAPNLFQDPSLQKPEPPVTPRRNRHVGLGNGDGQAGEI